MTQMNSTEPRKPRSVARAMGRIFGLGIPATAVMTAALAVVFAVAIDGCSGKNMQTSQNTNPSTNVAALPAPSPALSQTPAATPAMVAKKKTIKRPATVTYSDKTSGISFRYPWKYKLLTPDKGEEAKAELAKLPTNFMNASGTSIAAVELNNGPVSSFMNVSVVKGISAEQCQQFAMSSPQSNNETPIETDDESGVSKVSLRGAEFTKADEVTEQLEARYYHHFEAGLDKNTGSCYEFALGISEPPESTNPVDEVARFQQLERIFGTVKIQPEQVQVITASVPDQPVSVTSPQ